MIYISHRGNVGGPNTAYMGENTLAAIKDVLASEVLHIEIDVWSDVQTKRFILGHDRPPTDVIGRFQGQVFDPSGYTDSERQRLWIHCKNTDAVVALQESKVEYLNYFWHDKD